MQRKLYFTILHYTSVVHTQHKYFVVIVLRDKIQQQSLLLLLELWISNVHSSFTTCGVNYRTITNIYLQCWIWIPISNILLILKRICFGLGPLIFTEYCPGSMLKSPLHGSMILSRLGM